MKEPNYIMKMLVTGGGLFSGDGCPEVSCTWKLEVRLLQLYFATQTRIIDTSSIGMWYVSHHAKFGGYVENRALAS